MRGVQKVVRIVQKKNYTMRIKLYGGQLCNNFVREQMQSN